MALFSLSDLLTFCCLLFTFNLFFLIYVVEMSISSNEHPRNNKSADCCLSMCNCKILILRH